MVGLAEAKETAAAVGCKILNNDGTELIEAGSIVWKGGSAAGFGRGRKDIDAPEFSYAKPVDYVSGTCLLIEKDVFSEYGGFDDENFPNYYEDTDLQLHIQHDLGKEVWLQPKAVGLHDEHGSFGNEESTKLMQKASIKFYQKWQKHLEEKHVKAPFGLDKKEQEKSFFMAADLRARNKKYANLLYFDEMAPNKAQGSGFGRSFDNLSMIADLGHRVTLITEGETTNWCNKPCLAEIRGLGVEYVHTNKLKSKLFESRVGYYDVVVVSRPSTFYHAHKLLQNFNTEESPFSLIYDCEALWFSRNEMLTELVESKTSIPFPGYNEMVAGGINQETELKMLGMADTVLAVSKGEKKTISRLAPEIEDVRVVGHVMDAVEDKITKTNFSDRNGILYLAAFRGSMYYNGDAIWYFLKNVYPFVINAFKALSQDPIPLTIAGRGIPDQLRKVVKNNDVISPYVTFLESPPTIDHLFEEHRMFIAPHLYGAGIQFKVCLIHIFIVQWTLC